MSCFNFSICSLCFAFVFSGLFVVYLNIFYYTVFFIVVFKYIFYLFIYFIYFWLLWVLVVARGIFVEAGGGFRGDTWASL